MTIDDKTIHELVKKAKDITAQAYAPYSKFQVGAALLCDNGDIYCGVNVENASYGLASCAERNAIFHAIISGQKNLKIKAIAVQTAHDVEASPCGACRQVIREFATPQTLIIYGCGDQLKQKTMDDLLPDSFGPDALTIEG